MSVPLINELGCGTQCQADRDVQALVSQFNTENTRYNDLYKKLLDENTDVNRQAVAGSKAILDGLLGQITSRITSIQSTNTDLQAQANRLRSDLDQKTANLGNLNNQYSNKKALLTSREKQIEFAIRRANYSRMIMGILVVVNIIILLFFIGLLYTRIRRPTGFQGIMM